MALASLLAIMVAAIMILGAVAKLFGFKIDAEGLIRQAESATPLKSPSEG